ARTRAAGRAYGGTAGRDRSGDGRCTPRGSGRRGGRGSCDRRRRAGRTADGRITAADEPGRGRSEGRAGHVREADRTERSMPLRLREEIQEVPRSCSLIQSFEDERGRLRNGPAASVRRGKSTCALG